MRRSKEGGCGLGARVASAYSLDRLGRDGAGDFRGRVAPLVGPLARRPWSQVEIFAVAPDSTVLATLGVLIHISDWRKWLLLPIPLLWCLVNGATTWVRQSADATLMPIAAALAIAIVIGSIAFKPGVRM
jgi:hypothetical protein